MRSKSLKKSFIWFVQVERSENSQEVVFVFLKIAASQNLLISLLRPTIRTSNTKRLQKKKVKCNARLKCSNDLHQLFPQVFMHAAYFFLHFKKIELRLPSNCGSNLFKQKEETSTFVQSMLSFTLCILTKKSFVVNSLLNKLLPQLLGSFCWIFLSWREK